MRIGTWNLAGRWSTQHRTLMLSESCDIWLLTEVPRGLDLDGFHQHRSKESIVAERRWAAVLSKAWLTPENDPHPASCAATVEGITFCSSVLPWRSARPRRPWVQGKHAEKTRSALVSIELDLAGKPDVVWGGDWNHSLTGPETAGSLQGRLYLAATLERLQLQVPTSDLPHRLPGISSIDHIAVSRDLPKPKARWVPAEAHGRRLSDHDAYVVELP
ncbi:endonuclease/exonuclease/phosphatase family protein [Oryzihumus sp.]|uniref:endonuclease/exonuclease/phosphatase family protein n=1 Tax=Oryzihumus sp. TaxID=1968903 RepID=UPI002ED786D9